MKKLTAEWVRKAEADFVAAEQLASARPPVHDPLCFHCRTMRILVTLAPLLLSLTEAISASARTVTVGDFGAVGDGVTLNTRAIQAAIDQVAAVGGGTVTIPAGTFLSGTLSLKDHIRLDLEPGAVLLGSKRVEDYPLTICRYPSGSDRYVARALLSGEDLHDVAITGRGTIDGQGSHFANSRVSQQEWQSLAGAYQDPTRFAAEPHYINRPFLIRFVSCTNVLVEGVTLQKPAMWLQHYLNCDFVTIRHVNMFSHGSPNNDLIDIDGSRNVVITGCFGDSDDDGITLKSTSAAPVQNVTISDCIIRTRTNAIKAGTESSGGFQDITITNCVLKPSLVTGGFSGRPEGLAGIALEIVDGGSLDRVAISNIAMEDMAAPLFLRLGNRGRPYLQPQAQAPVGAFRNVKISHITASNAGRNGCSILGIKDHRIENVSISDVFIHFDGGGTQAQAEAEYPEHDEDYPESTRYGDLPAYGFFCRHVDGLTFRDVRLDFNAPEKRPPFIFDDVRNLNLFHVDARVANEAPALMVFRNSVDALVSECHLPETPVFLRLERNSDRIKVIGNDLTRVSQPFALDETVGMSALDVAGNLPADRSLFSLLQPAIARDEDGFVTMRSFTAGARIHYTLDGTEVTPRSTQYAQPFLQVGECEVEARVFKGGLASGTARVHLPQLPVRRPEVHPGHSFFTESVTVDLSCKTPGANILYSVDESAPVERWAVFAKAFEIRTSATLRVQATKAGHRPSEVAASRHELVPRENGVLYKYYLGEWDKLPDLLEMKPARTGRITQFRLGEVGTRAENFALLMIGYVSVPKAGQYTFYCGSN
ncbi:MAG: hypothetical protein A2V98_13090, partial [Planctomycetes bacterium RBG_16_64_12]